MWHTVAITILILCCVLGVSITALRLPGTWLIVVAALGYGWWSKWDGIGPVMVCLLAGIALIGEAVELAASALTTRRAGATRHAVWGGMAGGILGMIFLASLLSVPLPIVGTMIGAVLGALVGCFSGAMLAEMAMRKKLLHGAKVGLFSAMGFALGMVTKTALAILMSGIVLISVFSASRIPDIVEEGTVLLYGI